jgi:hypothetical protein
MSVSLSDAVDDLLGRQRRTLDGFIYLRNSA